MLASVTDNAPRGRGGNPMIRWIGLAAALLLAGPAAADDIEVKCPGVTWYGNADALQDCPCCKICRGGGFVIEGEGECGTSARSAKESLVNLPRSEIKRVTGVLLEGIAAFCNRKWKSDYSMQQNCRVEHAEALSKLIPYDALPDTDERKKIVGRCTSKWVEDGLIDWAMVEYCSKG